MNNKKLYTTQDSWKDYYHNIHNHLITLKNGVKLAITVNNETKETDFSAVIHGGAYFEDQIGVPKGTAHFLEHMIVGNPNSFLQTKNALDEYPMGTRYKAPFYHNAFTNTEFIQINGYGNAHATKRVIRFILQQLRYPTSRFEEFIEKERSIILNESKQRKKEEHNGYLQFNRFFFGEKYPEFSHDVLGNQDTISKITVQDLQKYYSHIVTKENVILTYHSTTFPSDDLLELIVKLTNTLPEKNKRLHVKKSPLEKKFKYKIFKDDQRQNIFCSLNYFYKIDQKIDYRRDRLYFYLSSALKKLLHDYIREEKMLVYEIGTINTRELFDYKDRGIYFLCQTEDLAIVLDEIMYVINEHIFDFLQSERGVKWLNDFISEYLFPRDSTVDRNYTEMIAQEILSGEIYKFDYRKAKAAAREITTKDVTEFIKKYFQKLPYVWIETNEDEKEVEKMFKKTKLFKFYQPK